MKSLPIFVSVALAAITVHAFAQPPVRSGLKINEVYFTGSFSGNILQANDQYIELYNPTQAPQYLDGMLIANISRASSGPASVNATGLQAYKFPGTPGGHQHRVDPGTFVVIARNAQDFTSKSGKNLSGADWEFFAGQFIDQDNSAPNLTPVGAGFIALDFAMNADSGAVMLCDGTDTTLTDGIADGTIIDAVEYHVSSPSTKDLPAQIDAGSAGVHARAGISIERKTAGEDTDNSTVDFDTTTCTPGFEHGAGSASNGVLPDIYPMSLGTRMIYDEYVLDTNGVRVQNSVHPYTTTVIDTTLVIGGQWCSAETDSTLTGAGTSTAAHSYLRNPTGIDVEQYADAQFFSTLLGPVGSFFTLPEQWVPMYNGSAGLKSSYHIASLDTQITASGTTVNVKLDVSGRWDGTDTVVVPAGTFATYRFKITIHTSAAVAILTLFDNTSEIDAWLARGVGVVKYSRPAVDISALGQSLAQPGSERELRGVGRVSAVAAAAALPHTVSIDGAFPNPVVAASALSFSLPATGRATLRLIDMTGRVVRTLVSGEYPAGTSHVMIDNRALAAGCYRAELETRWGRVSSVVEVVK